MYIGTTSIVHTIKVGEWAAQYIPFVCVSPSIRGTWLLHVVIQLWAGVTDIFIVCNGKLLQSFVVVTNRGLYERVAIELLC